MKVIFSAVVLTLLATLAHAEGPLQGKPAPVIPGAEQYQGQPILLDFWASWCGPCQESFPWMSQMQAKYPDLQIIAVNLDETSAAAKAFLADREVEFPIVYDPKGELAEQYRVDGMPSSYLIDRNGVVVRQHVGFFADETDDYEAHIKTLLTESAPAPASQ